MKIGIVGAGAWGKALKSVYKEHDVLLYSRRNNDVSRQDLYNVDYLLITLEAQEVKRFFSLNKFKAKIVLCSKGIDKESGELLYKTVKDLAPLNDVFVMSGPNFAGEIQSGLPAVSSIASEKLECAIKAAADLSTEKFKLLPTDDVVTICFAGSLKNVLAILCGVIRGLELGENFIAAAITKGIQEISYISVSNGGKLQTILEPGFIGDVFLTCNSVTSRNIRFGMDLINSQSRESGVVEGLHTSISLNNHYSNYKLPLLSLAYKIIHGFIDKDNIAEELKVAVFS